MKMRNVIVVAATILVVGGTSVMVSRINAQLLPAQKNDSVFARPRIFRETAVLQQQLLAAFGQQKHQVAESIAETLLALQPESFASHYNLACAQARFNKPDAALTSLRKAIELGFRSPKQLQQDNDLASLRQLEGWQQIIKQAAVPAVAPQIRRPKPAAITNGVAMVSEDNTVWSQQLTQLQVYFEPPDKATAATTVATGKDEIARLLNEWYAEGTAAGLSSVLYDNHDRDHSNMNYARFSQLARIEYSPAAAAEKLSNGLQNDLYYSRTTLGNSSTSLVGGAFWRSQPRFAYTNTRNAELLAFQYFRNHLYIYPEHRDYDPGQNGAGGYGDTYPANTPYVVISQGSSGSDRVFLDAIASTLAAFHPDVLQTLQANGTVYPCVQMILRRCLKSVTTDADYLSGIAHPPVFDGQQLDPLRMIQMAHSITPATLPPVVMLKVQQETNNVVGKDYFEIADREVLFTTPAAIARICRGLNNPKIITIDASQSQRTKGVDLKWHWVILQGDSARIEITPQNQDSTVATISVQHHERRPIREGSKMESSRVDVGVFVSNGTFFSPPAIVSFYWPEDEQRIYNDDGKIQSVQYTDHTTGGNYTDPLLITPKTWKDEYLYCATGQQIGWTRIREDSKQRFTADGALALTLDDQQRPLTAETVRYIATARGDRAPILEQTPGDEILEYEYASPDDQVGRISKRTSRPGKASTSFNP